MSADDAIGWLRRVNGQLYRNNPHPSGSKAWVAVVRVPATADQRATVIVALGSTMEEAADAARGQWRELSVPSVPLH